MALLDNVHLLGAGQRKVIFVHGWMAGAALFEPLHDQFDPSLFSCAYLDCRGYGMRRQEPGPYTVRQIALDILALADELGWQRFSVVGHSMAGMAAQWLLTQDPGRLESIVLLASVPASGAVVTDERRALLSEALSVDSARRSLISGNVSNSRSAHWLDSMLDLSLRTTWADAMRCYLDSWIGDGFAMPQQPTVGALVLVGELDPGCTEALMMKTVMSWLPNARLEVLPAVGHYPMRESPSMLASVLKAWFLLGASVKE